MKKRGLNKEKMAGKPFPAGEEDHDLEDELNEKAGVLVQGQDSNQNIGE
jgi:hypothetical protein